MRSDNIAKRLILHSMQKMFVLKKRLSKTPNLS